MDQNTKKLLITQVDYTKTPKRITRVKVFVIPNKGNYCAVITRGEVVSLMDVNVMFYTTLEEVEYNMILPESFPKDTDGLTLVFKYPPNEIKEKTFIKTEKNNNPEDNLENLPPVDQRSTDRLLSFNQLKDLLLGER